MDAEKVIVYPRDKHAEEAHVGLRRSLVQLLLLILIPIDGSNAIFWV